MLDCNNPDYSRPARQPLHLGEGRCVCGIQAVLLPLWSQGPLTPLPNQIGRVVISSGSGAKDVETLGDQLREMPPGPVVGKFDDKRGEIQYDPSVMHLAVEGG